jgi:quercetin dioxygenase-like cupin family protein
MKGTTYPLGLVIGLAIGAASGWFAKPAPATELPARPAGSNEALKVELKSAPGWTAVVADVVIPAGEGIPKHIHPGEEFVYVVAGAAQHGERAFAAGEGFVIPKGEPHAPRGGAAGARAVVFRLYPTGEAERTLVD